MTDDPRLYQYLAQPRCGCGWARPRQMSGWFDAAEVKQSALRLLKDHYDERQERQAAGMTLGTLCHPVLQEKWRFACRLCRHGRSGYRPFWKDSEAEALSEWNIHITLDSHRTAHRTAQLASQVSRALKLPKGVGANQRDR